MDINSNNKRIAKNTLFLYMRMIYTLLVCLYTSRVVLKVLGFVDYGLFNVIGGFVLIFASVNTAMSVASSRFLAYEIGKKEKGNLDKVFNTAIFIHFLIAVLLLFLCETIGYWFLLNKMNIPPDRIFACKWVYHCSVFGLLLSVLTVPFTSLIIAEEKMSAFAYLSILDVSIKLLIVYSIQYITYDRLIVYSILLLVIYIMDFGLYRFYIKKKFPTCHIQFMYDKYTFNRMIKFSLWAMFGNLSALGATQGVNVLLNMFGGPVLNAARGIAVQVQTAVQQFASNFQMALNPQIIKNYADNEYARMYNLMIKSSKYTFLLMYILSFPIIINTSFILNLWLGKSPQNTIEFIRIILVTSIITSMTNSLGVGIEASGNLKKFMSIVCTVTLLILPVSYVFLYLGMPPITTFYVALILESINYFIKLFLVHKILGMPCMDYIKKVLLTSSYIVLFSVILYFVIHRHNITTIYSFIQESLYFVIIIGLVEFFIGLNSNERKMILDFCLKAFKRHDNNI
ncbi:lipopolysaccharide biosynthesis protein [Xylanibacter oryzae]|uniref:lipopolysaccharide biosynthesis protein n=1 Tax=Xylanibacter oryzae TaxID=185293 RepID=UPI0004BC663B|nr:hypothetical protein [Xylanibacter oryzae]